ncbi:MAG: hypothetical protein WC842_01340 [Candidatus Paceibacterota bacterium]|jgi:hypothetical protein
MQIQPLLQQHKKQIILGLILGFVFAAGIFTPSVSNAMLGISMSSIITFVFKAAAYIFNFIFGIFFVIAAWLVSFTLQLNETVADKNFNTIADVGWRICRDVANLGFVLLTVIMAFTTIIRVQSYGAKKLLLNLVIAAVVVNFSFVIAGTLIDFSNVLTSFFINRISPNGLGTEFTETLAGAFGPQKFLLEETDDPLPPDPSQEESGLVTFGTAMLSSIAGLFFSVFFTILATIVLLLLAVMLLVRYVALTFILVLAPLAWLFWVFPGLKSYNSQWWSAFWKYTFFAPAVSFFVYLSILAAEGLKSAGYQEKIMMVGGGLPNMLAKIAQQGTQMIVVAGLMIGGIIVAQKMGIEGANIANKAKDGMMKKAKDYGKDRATNFGTRLSKTSVGGTVSSGLKKVGGYFKGTGEDIQKKREAAKAKHLGYKDQIATINNSSKSPEQKREEINNLKKVQDQKAENYNNALKEFNEKKKEINSNKDISKEQKKKDIEALKKQYDLENIRPDRLGFGSRIGLWAKDKTLGSTTRSVGGGIEATGKGIDKQAIKEIKKTKNWGESLVRGALLGAGLMKEKEKKDEKKTAAELEKDLQKKLKTKQDKLKLRNTDGSVRFKEDDLKEDNKQIEFGRQAFAGAYRSRLRNMEEVDIEKEHSSTLKQRKGAKTKDEEILANNKLDAIRQTTKMKTGRLENIEQIETALAKEKNRKDEAFVNGVDTTPYEKVISEYEGKIRSLSGRVSNRLEVFKKMEERLNALDKKRNEKLKEIASKLTSGSATEAREDVGFKQIETITKSFRSNIENVESVLSRKAQKLGELDKKLNDLNEIKLKTSGLSELELSSWGVTQEEQTELIKEIDKGILETQSLIEKRKEKREKKGEKKGEKKEEEKKSGLVG